MPIHYAGWNIIIDDIVFPDGRTEMARIGGGGFYATIGMRVWSRNVGLLAGVGDDFEMERLENLGLDTTGVMHNGLPTARAWQVFEYDGKRTEIPRVTREEWEEQLMPKLPADSIKESLKGLHFQTSGRPSREVISAELNQSGIFIGAEPTLLSNDPQDKVDSLLAGLSKYPLFSPDEIEIDRLVGWRPAKDALKVLADRGPRIVALRQGAKGSLVFDSQTGDFLQVPVVETTVVDVTGAGNAYIGGFIVGIDETGDVTKAAAYATVAASFVIEQVGPPIITPEKEQMARQRYETVVNRIQRVS